MSVSKGSNESEYWRHVRRTERRGFLGVLASAVCFVLWSHACSVLGMVRSTVGLYLTPIVGVSFAAMFLKERLTLFSVAGGVLILWGVAVANIRREERK